MRLLLPLCLIVWVAYPTCLRADDAAVAKQMQSLGGTVVAKEDVVTQLTFKDSSKLGAAEIQAIGQLTRLKSLTLYGKAHGLNDQTVPLLANLKELESLGTDGAQLTDDGLKHLAALTNLKSASFFHLSFLMKGFTGAGFAHLKACSKLEKLTVAGMSMGDAGFAAIGGLTQLRELRTWHTFQTEAGNAHIAKLPNLTSLQLGQRLPGHGNKGPSLSDASLATVAGMTSLESLKLGEARFSVDALAVLKTLPKLKLLTLHETELTELEVERLRAILPGVKIDWQPITNVQRKKLAMYLKE